MQIQLKNRDALALNGTITFSNPVDVSNAALLVAALVVYTIAGTTPVLTIQLQTSDDLETWSDLGSSFNRGTTGATRSAIDAKTTPYGRYVRAKASLTGTDPLVGYSLWLSTYQSS